MYVFSVGPEWWETKAIAAPNIPATSLSRLAVASEYSISQPDRYHEPKSQKLDVREMVVSRFQIN